MTNSVPLPFAPGRGGRRHARTSCFLSLTFPFFAACGGTEGPTTVQGLDFLSDLILHDGTVLALDAAGTTTQAIAVVGGQVRALGTNEEILATAGPGTTFVDLEGRTAMPGLIDAHTHLFWSAFRQGRPLTSAQDTALSYGITTLGELGMSEEGAQALGAMEAAGELIVRVNRHLRVTNNCGELQGDWFLQYPVDRTPGRKLWTIGIKMFTDGGSCGLQAFSEPFYTTREIGPPFHDQRIVDSLVALGHDNGYQVAIHAMGDLAVGQSLDALEASLAGGPNSLRHRIEHNNGIRDDQLPRYGELDVVAVVFGWQRLCRTSPEDYPATDFQREVGFRTRDLIEQNAGMHVAWHGDDPAVGPVNPFRELHFLVTRTTSDGTGAVCGSPDWFREQALPVAVALRLMTLGSAYALFREAEVGSLEPGKAGDIIIVSDNPLGVPPDLLKDIRVLSTFVDGQLVYSRAPGDSHR